MASPQKENGYLEIANELVDEFCKLNLSSYEWRVLWAIIRKTWGWRKKEDFISFGQFEKITGIKRRHLQRTIKFLHDKQIIAVEKKGQYLKYRFQKDHCIWKSKLAPKEVTVDYNLKRLRLTSEPLPVEVTEPLPVEVTTKDNKYKRKKEKTGFSQIPKLKCNDSKEKIEMQWLTDFEEFWKIYDYPIDPTDTKNAYFALRRKGVTKEEILDGVKGESNYLKHRRINEGFDQSRKYPASFLRKDKWKTHIGFKFKSRL